MASVAAGWLLWRQVSRSKLSRASVILQRLTTNATENRIEASAISPDGKYLAYSDQTGAYLRLLSTGEVHPLLPKASDVTFLGWFPDGSQLLASWTETPIATKRLWALSIMGANPRQISAEGWSASVSPDGSQVVWSSARNGLSCRTLIWMVGGSSGCRMHVWSMRWMNRHLVGTARTFGQLA